MESPVKNMAYWKAKNAAPTKVVGKLIGLAIGANKRRDATLDERDKFVAQGINQAMSRKL